VTYQECSDVRVLDELTEEEELLQDGICKSYYVKKNQVKKVKEDEERSRLVPLIPSDSELAQLTSLVAENDELVQLGDPKVCADTQVISEFVARGGGKGEGMANLLVPTVPDEEDFNAMKPFLLEAGGGQPMAVSSPDVRTTAYVLTSVEKEPDIVPWRRLYLQGTSSEEVLPFDRAMSLANPDGPVNSQTVQHGSYVVPDLAGMSRAKPRNPSNKMGETLAVAGILNSRLATILYLGGGDGRMTDVIRCAINRNSPRARLDIVDKRPNRLFGWGNRVTWDVTHGLIPYYQGQGTSSWKACRTADLVVSDLSVDKPPNGSHVEWVRRNHSVLRAAVLHGLACTANQGIFIWKLIEFLDPYTQWLILEVSRHFGLVRVFKPFNSSQTVGEVYVICGGRRSTKFDPGKILDKENWMDYPQRVAGYNSLLFMGEVYHASRVMWLNYTVGRLYMMKRSPHYVLSAERLPKIDDGTKNQWAQDVRKAKSSTHYKSLTRAGRASYQARIIKALGFPTTQ